MCWWSPWSPWDPCSSEEPWTSPHPGAGEGIMAKRPCCMLLLSDILLSLSRPKMQISAVPNFEAAYPNFPPCFLLYVRSKTKAKIFEPTAGIQHDYTLNAYSPNWPKLDWLICALLAWSHLFGHTPTSLHWRTRSQVTLNLPLLSENNNFCMFFLHWKTFAIIDKRWQGLTLHCLDYHYWIWSSFWDSQPSGPLTYINPFNIISASSCLSAPQVSPKNWNDMLEMC